MVIKKKKKKGLPFCSISVVLLIKGVCILNPGNSVHFLLGQIGQFNIITLIIQMQTLQVIYHRNWEKAHLSPTKNITVSL